MSSYLDSCYNTDMHLKNKNLAPLLLILACILVGSAAGACSSSIGKKSNANVAAAANGDEEEVLDPENESNDFADPDSDEQGSAEKTGGGILVSVTYLVMSLGAAALPFLLLL